MKKKIKKPILLLVDGHSLAFRSFYAFSKGGEGGLTTKDGFPTSVTYGFLKSLLDNCKLLGPEAITIAFDTPEPTFRHKSDPNYKANRDVAPDIFFQDLEQLQKILEKALNISMCSVEGYEADDVLGTLAYQAIKDGWSVRILTGDRDLFQLVNDSLDIAVLYMGGGPYSKSGQPSLIKESEVIQKLGVIPTKVVELKALTGDSSDNIPGIKGVGPKTAINLLKENGDLDGIYTSLERLEALGDKATKGCIKGALKAKLKVDKDNAYHSKYLAEIIKKVPIKKQPNSLLSKINTIELRNSLEELELFSLVRQIEIFKATFSAGGYLSNKDQIKVDNNEIKRKPLSISQNNSESINNSSIDINPQIINTADQLTKLVSNLMTYKDIDSPIAIDTETTDLNPFKAELVGIGLCWGEGKKDLAYIPIGHKLQNEIFSPISNNQLGLDTVINELRPWLSSNEHPKVLQNAKYDRLILLRHGINLDGVTIDTLLADYLLDASNKHSLEEIAKREFSFTPTSFNEIVDKGKTFADVSIDSASLYCGMDVYLTRKLSKRLKSSLQEVGNELIKLLYEVEQPLETVLAHMENTGIRIDVPYLQKLSNSFQEKLSCLEGEIQQEAGIDFNLNSPKQLAEVLFENLNLNKKKSRKTKTGWSTDAAVLEKLSSEHTIIPKLIEHRTISKLLSTYIDALPQLVESETQRVHTDFNQAVTTTGRLSSSNPNLQNIPSRTEFSKQIRKAFLPKENWKLLSADYSQIELRILAHLSEEEVLQKAYKNKEDVHSLTAKLLLEKDSINADERRLGKTINFGVIYGMGAQRFARAAGVTQQEAKDFLARFKERYKNIFKFLELQEKLALSRGYVTTILGRRRYFNFDKSGLGRLLGKDINEIDLLTARRAGIEAQQLRAAANAPIQGSSADIIKIAMLQISSKLKASSLPANLLLQVHDELVLEVDPKALNEVKQIVVNTMENALTLSVPLTVETGIGNNWMECK
ncbi:DNA polymerase I [Prochlorococcus sp. MIT 1223]|uniref:DNA polymerase I n=1 Tax=Prochlorococcus sp. MIT 1223 TaxID=3096217 RepID=UPI002A75B98C|nr:DNA polymerase I [Prochlorococcus sp. MIT 1223]